MDTYADDLSVLIEALGLNGITLVGHSAGGGEVARYIGRHGTKRVAKAVLVGAVTPLMLKRAANPGGLAIEAFNKIRVGVAADRSQFFKDLTTPFFGANRPGAKVSQGVRDAFWLRGMQGGLKNELDCIKAFSETDFTEDLEKFDVPTLIIHGDDDQIVPIGPSAHASAKLVKRATLKIYPGGSHGLADTNKDQLNADLLAFLQTRGRSCGGRAAVACRTDVTTLKELATAALAQFGSGRVRLVLDGSTPTTWIPRTVVRTTSTQVLDTVINWNFEAENLG